MPVYKDENPTKDGRQWFFRSRYKDLDGTKKQYHSKKYATRREALEAEAEFKIKALEEANVSTVTFQQMIELFIEQRSSSVKETTMYNYQNKKRFLEPLYNIRLTNFNIETYERWRQYINRCNIGTRYKNDIYKFLKSVLNYATDWYGFNFVHVYRKMQNFNNPNEMPKEMLFFTYDEFQQFLAVEEDIKFRCAFQLLYYCGLRIGELKGLTWKDIDFDNKTVTINKQITKQSSRGNWRFVPPKTKKSNRVLPLTKVLLNDLKTLKESDKEILFGFNDKFFVVGDIAPASNNRFSDRKNKNCEKAGVKQIRLDDFRHSCASLLIYKGASINMVSKFLGHSKIEETLNTYTHLYSNALSDITNLIDEMNES